jgi:hypothetical protein
VPKSLLVVVIIEDDAFNGEALDFYGHHEVQIPTSSHLATYNSASSRGVNVEAATETAATVEYHHLLNCDNHCVSFETFKPHISILGMLKTLVTSGQLKERYIVGIY